MTEENQNAQWQEIQVSGFQIPVDVTYEEMAFLDLIKERMLEKLDDRKKFLFVYCIELGHEQSAAARILGVNEPNISRQMRRIRAILAPFKKNM